jgi:hypothetical protein
MMEDKPIFFFFHFQRTGCEILNARHGDLFLKSLRKLFKFQKKCNGLPGMLDLRQQRTIKATGNARHLHLQTLSLALALARRSQCEHLFFLLWQFFPNLKNIQIRSFRSRHKTSQLRLKPTSKYVIPNDWKHKNKGIETPSCVLLWNSDVSRYTSLGVL